MPSRVRIAPVIATVLSLLDDPTEATLPRALGEACEGASRPVASSKLATVTALEVLIAWLVIACIIVACSWMRYRTENPPAREPQG